MRRAILTVAVSLFAAAPAQAQTLCVGQKAPKPPLTKEQQIEASLQDRARQRAEFGFRADLPYVRELVRRGVWEYDVGYISVTPAENKYLRLRDELELELGPRAERYLDRQKDVDGGGSIEDGWRSPRTACAPTACAGATASCRDSGTGSGTTRSTCRRSVSICSRRGSATRDCTPT